MQNLTQPTLLLKPFAENGQRNSIPENATGTNQASLDEGFPPVTGQNPRDGGIPPTRLDFNGLGYLTTTYDYFYQAGGCFTFNQVVSDAIGGYPLNARLWYLDENGESSVLRSTKNNNTDNFLNDPSVIGDSWVYDVATTTYVKDEINEIRTNCITEIPQDIKLELNNGTLTLKAGSKVYVPNGAGVFDVVTIASDLTHTTTANIQMVLCVLNGTSLAPFVLEKSFSGATPPVGSGAGAMLWYDTANNKMKISTDNGATWIERRDSLPIAIVTADSTSYSSIDQVFNGFGYIGSTIFALPGVKGLIPNGRNADGTLRNKELVTTYVRTTNVSGTYNFKIALATTGIGAYMYDYDAVKNAIYRTDTGAYYNADRLIAGDVSVSNGKITSFQPKTPFHAVDYNDFVDLEEKVDTKQDIATAVNYDNITNCITDIPQDIKVSLSNGNVVINAGTKYYIPRGNSNNSTVFVSFTLSSDSSVFGTPSEDGVYMIFLEDVGNPKAYAYKIDECLSGDGDPTLPFSGVYYRTPTYNRILEYAGNASVRQLSLPLVIATFSGGSFVSINQVFNGFGYIGSTVFNLPGVKGLIPDGRNEDGSLRSIERTRSTVVTRTLGGTGVDFLGTNLVGGFDYVPLSQYNVSDTTPPSGTRRWYNPDTNYLYNTEGGGISNFGLLYIGNISLDNGRITSLQTKTTFHAVDYNDAVKYSDFATTKATTVSTASNTKPAVVVQNYKNGTNWYRVWSDGWIEQGGIHQANGDHTITLLKPFTTNNYTVTANLYGSSTWPGEIVSCYTYATSNSVATISVDKFPNGMGTTSNEISWCACGY